MPLADTRREVPEQLHVSAGGAAAGATVVLRDTVPAAANQLLFVAHLRPIFGTSSTGGGTATVRLPGDNDVASVAVSFSNLRSPVQEVRIEAPDGTALAGVDPSGYSGQAWPIRAGGPYATDQEVLDALLSAELCVCIRSEGHPSGEIRGKLIAASGTIEFAAPPGPPTVEPLAGSELDQDIARFLTQATFGPTMADIEAMRGRVARHSGDRIAAFSEWIDEQFAMPSPSLLAYTMAADRQEIEIRASLPTDHPDYQPAYEPDRANRTRGWWLLARHGPDQLRQRTAFALSEIFVVSDLDQGIRWRPYGMANYYDMLRTGASGSYRELLEGVATHPVMGQYLSHLRNSKAVLDEAGNPVVSPDENFARELMQLFSIGLVELHPDGTLRVGTDGLPIPTYEQDDIAEMARVFTGWSFSVVNSPPTSDTVVANTNFYSGDGTIRPEAQWTHPMAMFPEHHDSGEKTLLGLTLPAGQTGEEDLRSVLDHLASHPNAAPFICRRLIQRLVTANPSSGYLYRVAGTFTASGGSLEATFKAILLDPEARSPGTALASASSGKKREPLLRFLALMRACDGKTGLLLSDLAPHGYPTEELAKFPPDTPRVRLGVTDFWLAQTPQSAPSVFNWFSPDHIPAGILAANGLFSPELQLTNENSVFQEINLGHLLIYNAVGTSPLPGQELPPFEYPAGSQILALDLAPFEACYMEVVDTNGDGNFTSLDTGTFNQPAAISAAAAAVVDRIDLLHCAGSLKQRHGDVPGRPRRIIIEAVAAIQSGNNHVNLAPHQAAYMRLRIRNALWLVMSSPDAAIQK